MTLQFDSSRITRVQRKIEEWFYVPKLNYFGELNVLLEDDTLFYCTIKQSNY
jgi:hypothetical protein